jgi:acid phosphatase (class A)
MMKLLVFTLAVVAALMAQGCANRPSNQDAVPSRAAPLTGAEVTPSMPAGYLPASATPDSLQLLPPPPSPGSAAAALDEDVNRRSIALQSTARGTLAVRDADLSFPDAAGTFSCAIDAPITERDTPHLYRLLQRTLVDAIHSTTTAKDHYLRVRPYVLNKEPLCAPTGSVGSYPSGHSTIGWAWALILTAMASEHTDAILARGRAFGQSRLICNAHWQSDVVEGRFLGAGTFARLQADPAFRADFAAAVGELGAARAQGLKPTRDCAAEAAALALQPPSLR